MIGWGDFNVKLEQHHDRLRRAEKNQLLEQAAANRKGALYQTVRKLVWKTGKQQTVGDSAEVGQPGAIASSATR